MTTPPVGACTFTLAVASTSAGTYSVINTFTWPAGLSGSRQVPVGVGGNLAAILNNQAAWVRVSVTTTGAFTLAGSWLTKASDGSFGLASRSYHLDNLTGTAALMQTAEPQQAQRRGPYRRRA